jgi:hypothetical protein
MYFLFFYVPCIVSVYMCTEQLPPGGYQIAVKYISSYHPFCITAGTAVVMVTSQTSQHTEDPIHNWFVRTEETRKEDRTSGIPAYESSRRRMSRTKIRSVICRIATFDIGYVEWNCNTRSKHRYIKLHHDCTYSNNKLFRDHLVLLPSRALGAVQAPIFALNEQVYCCVFKLWFYVIKNKLVLVNSYPANVERRVSS